MCQGAADAELGPIPLRGSGGRERSSVLHCPVERREMVEEYQGRIRKGRGEGGWKSIKVG